MVRYAGNTTMKGYSISPYMHKEEEPEVNNIVSFITAVAVEIYDFCENTRHIPLSLD
jgi:hypothetical protein